MTSEPEDQEEVQEQGQEQEAQERATEGQEVQMTNPSSDQVEVAKTATGAFAPHDSEHAKELVSRKHPRELREGDALIREFRWGGNQAFECRFPVEFEGEEGTNDRWSIACCHTFFTKEQLARHVHDEHFDSLPEEVR